MTNLSPSVRSGLQTIYAEVDQQIAALGPRCDLSGRCCRFDEYGHRLYITQPEADLLLEQGLPPNAQVTTAGCPFQINNLCTARERRPLGCRVYFCDPHYEPLAPEITEEGIRKLKLLHQMEQIEWNYADLYLHLTEHLARTNPAPESPPPEIFPSNP